MEKQAERFFRGVAFLEKWPVPGFLQPYVLGLFLRRWPHKVK